MFIKHYRKHLKLDKQTYLCNTCFNILKCSRKTAKICHNHEPIIATCCEKKFSVMSELVVHKLIIHNFRIISANEKIKSNENCQSDNNNSISDRASVIDNIRLFTCNVPGCNKVFSTNINNYCHYRQHAKISGETSMCSICLLRYPPENYSKKHCEHKNQSFTCYLCSINFVTLHEFAMHKLDNHSAVIYCNEKDVIGCPVCGCFFANSGDSRKHYKQCLIKLKRHVFNDEIPDSSIVMRYLESNENGNIQCTKCKGYLSSLDDYIYHSKTVHNNLFMLKDIEISLCPICDQNYFSKQFIEHFELCTMSMSFDAKNSHFSCAICKVNFYNIPPSIFRSHFLFCKSFRTRMLDHNELM